jgi:hypothetical protein
VAHEISRNSCNPCKHDIASYAKKKDKELVRGAIVGVVDVVDCVDKHKSKWFGGPVVFVLKNPRPLKKPIAQRLIEIREGDTMTIRLSQGDLL